MFASTTRVALAAAALLATGAQAQSAAPGNPPAAAATSDERAGLEALRATTLGLIQALVDQGLLTRARADALIQQAARAPSAAAASAANPPAAGWGAPLAGAPSTVRVPYVPEAVRQEIRDQVRDEVLASVRTEANLIDRATADWLRRLSIDGDMRFRVERDAFDKDNIAPEVFRAQTESPAWAPDLTNTRRTRDRQTIRARVGVNAALGDTVQAGVRLSTGNGPVSGSQTLGNDYSRFTATFDRAWLRYTPVAGVSIEGGRMPNPFFATDLVWPDDLSPDGLALRALQPVGGGVEVFGTAVVSPLEELATTRKDKWLYGVQVGAAWKPSDRFSLKAGLAYYDFHNVQGERESELPPTGALAGTTDYFASQYPASVRQKGNTLINLNAPGSTASPTWGLASKFRPIEATLVAAWQAAPAMQLGLALDYVHNTGFDLGDIQQRAATVAVADLAEKVDAYQARLTFGRPQLAAFGDWQVSAAYRLFERDAWIDAFTDTTWHLGGTNYKGFQVGASFAFDKRSVLGLRWTSTQNLDDGRRFLAIPGDPSSLSGNMSSAPLKIDVLQLDATVRF